MTGIQEALDAILHGTRKHFTVGKLYSAIERRVPASPSQFRNALWGLIGDDRAALTATLKIRGTGAVR